MTNKIVIDLGFGDSGKGTMVDYLSQKPLNTKPPLIIRFNGGSQAAHNVHTKDGFHHTFSNFGSGYFNECYTYLSKYISIDPITLYYEGLNLRKYNIKNNISMSPFSFLRINKDCLVITPIHRFINRVEESTINNHGSCGIGFGVTVRQSLEPQYTTIRISDLISKKKLKLKLNLLKEEVIKDEKIFSLNPSHKEGISQFLDKNLKKFLSIIDILRPIIKIIICDYEQERKFLRGHKDNIIFEGAQGILLDEYRGFHPHTTWSNTTSDNALDIIKTNSLSTEIETIGIIRSYSTRHGNGPFPTDDPEHYFISDDDDNVSYEYQSTFRSGILDINLLLYSLKCQNVDYIAMTHYDKVKDRCKISYNKSVDIEINEDKFNLDKQKDITKKVFNLKQYPISIDKEDFLSTIEKYLKTDIYLVSEGKTKHDKYKRSKCDK